MVAGAVANCMDLYRYVRGVGGTLFVSCSNLHVVPVRVQNTYQGNSFCMVCMERIEHLEIPFDATFKEWISENPASLNMFVTTAGIDIQNDESADAVYRSTQMTSRYYLGTKSRF